jgi:NADH dehydrogenase
MRVAVVGATGFVGSHVVPVLVAAGHEVVAVSRHGARLPGWPESVRGAAADVTIPAGLDAALEGSDAAVHLVAIPRESRGRRFEALNVGGTSNLVAAAERACVRRLVHLSVLGAVNDPALGYLRSKWQGEQIVRGSQLGWTILRPSLLFGEGDGFFNLLKTTLTWWSPLFVAIPGDGSARFQPLSVEDLAIAVRECLGDPDRAGQVYELGGPDVLTYRQIVDRVMAATGKRRIPMSVPIPLISALTAVTDRVLPVFPVSHDQVGSLRTDNVTEVDAFERIFGIPPRALDLSYLRD